MEFCMEGALKPSLRRELSFLKQNQQVIFDDINSCGVVSNNNEDFSVDDLLDFSNGDFEEEEEEEEEDGSVDDKDSFSSRDLVDADADADADADVDDDNNSNSGSLSSDQSLLTNELVEPIDDYAELEWVSQFVDDSSCSELSLLYPNARSEPDKKPVFHKTTSTTTPCLPLRVPSKARTKRTRPSGRVWSFGSPLSPESRTVSTSSSTTTTPGLILTNAVQAIEWFTGGFDEPVSKKPKKKMAVQGGGLFLRRCSHCQTQKTPQWRTGPLGPKTLCNACGVRFKSGRLFPEYRPACSPTFSVDVHSNSHRKVLEMRQKKESSRPEVGLNQMIHSF